MTPAVGTGLHKPMKVGPLKTHVPGIIGTAGPKNEQSNAKMLVFTKDQPQTFLELVLALFVTFLYWIENASRFLGLTTFLPVFQADAKALRSLMLG